MEILNFISEVGFPIAASCIGIYFVYLTQKFILEIVLEKIKNLITITEQLNVRIVSMNEELDKIDSLINRILDIPEENV